MLLVVLGHQRHVEGSQLGNRSSNQKKNEQQEGHIGHGTGIYCMISVILSFIHNNRRIWYKKQMKKWLKRVFDQKKYGRNACDFCVILKKRGIDEEELIPSTKEHCIVEPMIIRKILPIIGFCIYTFFTIVLFLTRDGKIWMYLLLGVIDLLLLYYSGVYWYDQLEVQDKLYKKDFLKKMRTVEFKEITKVEQHKSIIEKEYIIIYVKGEKPIKIDRYNENVEVLLMRLKDEKISVM